MDGWIQNNEINVWSDRVKSGSVETAILLTCMFAHVNEFNFRHKLQKPITLFNMGTEHVTEVRIQELFTLDGGGVKIYMIKRPNCYPSMVRVQFNYRLGINGHPDNEDLIMLHERLMALEHSEFQELKKLKDQIAHAIAWAAMNPTPWLKT